MSAETFTTAMFLITAVIAAGVLINAVFPVVFQMASTFSSSTHASDVRLRTDFTIVTTFASDDTSTLKGQIWMKNIGTESILKNLITNASDVYFGPVGNVKKVEYSSGIPGWQYTLTDLNNNGAWDPGETIEIDPWINANVPSGTFVYFQFVLPNGVYRSIQYAVG
jgi:archaeal flagellar protein FlaG